MKVMSIVLVSKRVPGLECGGSSKETSMAAQLKKKAHDVPITTSTSMVGEPCFSDFQAET